MWRLLRSGSLNLLDVHAAAVCQQSHSARQVQQGSRLSRNPCIGRVFETCQHKLHAARAKRTLLRCRLGCCLRQRRCNTAQVAAAPSMLGGPRVPPLRGLCGTRPLSAAASMSCAAPAARVRGTGLIAHDAAPLGCARVLRQRTHAGHVATRGGLSRQQCRHGGAGGRAPGSSHSAGNHAGPTPRRCSQPRSNRSRHAALRRTRLFGAQPPVLSRCQRSPYSRPRDRARRTAPPAQRRPHLERPARTQVSGDARGTHRRSRLSPETQDERPMLSGLAAPRLGRSCRGQAARAHTVGPLALQAPGRELPPVTGSRRLRSPAALYESSAAPRRHLL